jgi:5'(3')-deoxyribonucleotidase
VNLLTYLNSIQLPWFILTSPGKQSHAYSAKVEWCRRRLMAHEHQVIVTKHKPLLAAPGRLLIDDNPENCKNWMVHGGTAILWPQPGNVFHAQQADPLPRVLYEVHQFVNQRQH